MYLISSTVLRTDFRRSCSLSLEPVLQQTITKNIKKTIIILFYIIK